MQHDNCAGNFKIVLCAVLQLSSLKSISGSVFELSPETKIFTDAHMPRWRDMCTTGPVDINFKNNLAQAISTTLVSN